MAKGRVKWFNRVRGYGLISPDNGGDDVFVHYSDIQQEGFRYLDENDAVSYETEETEKGLKAVKVQKL